VSTSFPYLRFKKASAPAFDEPAAPEGYRFSLWQPSLVSIVPPTFGWPEAKWWAYHYAGVFRNEDYRVLYLKQGNEIVHRLGVLPTDRMDSTCAPGDLSVVWPWTHPEHGDQGLETAALRRMLWLLHKPERTFWCVVRKGDRNTVQACREAGFELVGEVLSA